MNGDERIQVSWSELKTLKTNKSLNLNYFQAGSGYYVFLNDNNILWMAHLTDSGDISDFEFTYKTDANKTSPIPVQIQDGIHPPVDIIASGGKWRMCTDAIVTVEEIFGFDDYADTWFFVTNAGTNGSTFTVTIANTSEWMPGYTKVITSDGTKDIYEMATYIVQELNNDVNFNAYWAAKHLNNVVFVISRVIAEKGETTGLNVFTVPVTGTATVNIPAECGEIIRRHKTTMLTPDARDNRLGILGVRGEVSTLQRAENPIFANIKATGAAADMTVIFERWTAYNWVDYMLQFAMGSQLGSEFEVYHVLEQDRTISGLTRDPVITTDVQLAYTAIEVPTAGTNQPYISYVKKNGSTVAWGNGASNYRIVDDPHTNVFDKSHIRFGTALAPGDTVEIKYDASLRVANLWCANSDSVVYPLSAPVKVNYGQGIVAVYKNHSSNSGVVTFNVNGYRIDANEVFI